MASQLEKPWRLIQTGLSFAFFGGVVLLLGFVAIPASRRLARNPGRDDLHAQRWIHRGARLFVAFMRGIGLVRLDRVDTARLRAGGPLLVVANHPTLFDLPVILSLMPQADCIVGAQWAENFFLRRVVAVAGYARNDDGSSVIRACLRHLESGRSVVIFPEGTRSPRAGSGPFAREPPSSRSGAGAIWSPCCSAASRRRRPRAGAGTMFRPNGCTCGFAWASRSLRSPCGTVAWTRRRRPVD